MKYKDLPEGETCVSLINYKDMVLLATTKHIYEMVANEEGEPVMRPILFEVDE